MGDSIVKEITQKHFDPPWSHNLDIPDKMAYEVLAETIHEALTEAVAEARADRTGRLRDEARLELINHLEAVVREAFLLGFMASREGFNGEVAETHLAPRRGLMVDSGHDSERHFRQRMAANSAFLALQAEAVARLVGEYGEDGSE